MNPLIAQLLNTANSGLTCDPTLTVAEAAHRDRRANPKIAPALKADITIDTRHPLLKAVAEILHNRRIELRLNAAHLDD